MADGVSANKEMVMGRYAAENAIHRIDGYFVPRPNESEADAFERAKAECLVHMDRARDETGSITLAQFVARRREAR